jgi:hypothetical protein
MRVLLLLVAFVALSAADGCESCVTVFGSCRTESDESVW